MSTEDTTSAHNPEVVHQLNFVLKKYLDELDVIERKGAILKQYIETETEKTNLKELYHKILNLP